VGELGVVSFGGGGGAAPLHPLERPFTDADGVRVMAQASRTGSSLFVCCLLTAKTACIYLVCPFRSVLQYL
jgi:hypothetical protein